MSSSDMLATIAFNSGYLPKKCSRTYPPSRLLNFWYSPSTASSMRLSRNPCLSCARSVSQYEPQITLITFQPAPRNTASSSWMILPLPRTGPSSRCRLQLMTKMRLSRLSRAAVLVARSVPEMVEADVVERRGRGEARDVAAELEVLLARAQHHRHRVPAHERAQPRLELLVARRALLEMRRDRVDVRGLRAVRKVRAGAPRLVDELLEDEVRALGSFDLEHRFERIDPFPGFQRIDVLQAFHGGTSGGI